LYKGDLTETPSRPTRLTFELRLLVNLKDIHPMLATSAAQLPEGEQWSYEVKWDGYRTLAVKDGARVTLLSRNLKDATAQYPNGTSGSSMRMAGPRGNSQRRRALSTFRPGRVTDGGSITPAAKVERSPANGERSTSGACPRRAGRQSESRKAAVGGSRARQ
jgi:hypothetical protein